MASIITCFCSWTFACCLSPYDGSSLRDEGLSYPCPSCPYVSSYSSHCCPSSPDYHPCPSCHSSSSCSSSYRHRNPVYLYSPVYPGSLGLYNPAWEVSRGRILVTCGLCHRPTGTEILVRHLTGLRHIGGFWPYLACRACLKVGHLSSG